MIKSITTPGKFHLKEGRGQSEINIILKKHIVFQTNT